MFQLIAIYALLFMTIVTSVMGAIYLMRGSRIFELKLTTRNFMYIGACCAMTSGILGANLSAGQQMPTLWNYVLAFVLILVGLVATAHIVVDLSDRLAILKRSTPAENAEIAPAAKPSSRVYDLSAYRLNLKRGC